MKPKWVIKSYRDGDEHEILELWKAVYPEKQIDREKWLKWWRWMYKENPTGHGWITLAEDKGKIIGQSALIPVLMKIGTQLAVVFLGIDAMTHPDYRHQGIFYRLALSGYAAASEDNVNIGYTLPNDNNFLILTKKLNHIGMPNMQLMVKVFDWRNAIKLKIQSKIIQRILAIGANVVFNELLWRTQKPPHIEGLSVHEITSFNEQFDELWNKICNQSQIMVVKNRNYLNWRYGAPDTNYSIFAAEKDQKIRGCIVLRHKTLDGVKVSTIFDLIAESAEIMHCLVSQAIKDSRNKGADLLGYSSISSEVYHNVLKRSGFMSFPFTKGSYFTVYANSSTVSKGFLSNSQNWLVQTGDSDDI